MNRIRKLISLLIREELGRNFHTVNTSPNTFESFKDYEIIIDPLSDSLYVVSVYFKGKKLGQQSRFNNHEEAKHYARMIIDRHRVSYMNSLD